MKRAMHCGTMMLREFVIPARF